VELKAVGDSHDLRDHDISEALAIADVIIPVVSGKIDRSWIERRATTKSLKDRPPPESRQEAPPEPRLLTEGWIKRFAERGKQ